jgi:hypothetical protein
MTFPRHLTHGRRPGAFPGRRFAFVAVICGALALPSAAVADSSDFPVLVGNVYGAGPTPQPFTKTFDELSQSQQCQTAPPAPYDEHGAGGLDFSDNLGGPDSWTLAEALTCGPTPVLPSLQFGDMTVVDVNGHPEVQAGSAITPQDFTGSGGFPANTFPLVSVAGGSSSQIRYDRPWRGGDDENAQDTVGPSGQPITVDVFTGAQLTVTVTLSPTQLAPGGSVTFTPNIAPVTQGLTYEWNFGNGDTSNAVDPTETFTVAGNYPVSLVVHDDQGAGGAGGLTLDVGTVTNPGSSTTGAVTPPTPTTGTTPGKPTRHPRRHHDPGPGTHTGTSTTSTTTTSTAHTATTTTTSSSSTTTPTTSTTHTTTAPPAPGASPERGTPAPTTPTATTPTTPPPVTSTPTTATTPPPAQTAPTHTTPTPGPAHPARLPLVTGQLIASVNAVPAGSSPLVHAVQAGGGAAAVAHVPESSGSPWALIGSLTAVAALLGLGAWRERRGGPDWRSLRPPWSRPH